MAKTILVADDEPKIRKMITRFLKEERYTIHEAEDGIQALDVLENEHIDIILLDLMMPRLDGESFVKAVRKFSNVYIIVITAKTGENSQVNLYGLGADDYIEKPFSLAVLTSKIAAVANRLDQKAYTNEIITPDGLHIDSVAREVRIDGVNCELKTKEFELLQYLTRNQNVALSRNAILNGVWGHDYFGGDRTVDIHISRLRKKLADYGKYIQTISNYGYKWEASANK